MEKSVDQVPNALMPRLGRRIADSMWVRAVGSAVLYGVVAWAGIELTRYGDRIAALWPANGLLLAILMAEGEKDYFPRLALAYVANVIANHFTGDSTPVAFFLAACNSVEILCALLLMRAETRVSWTRMEHPVTLVAFAVYVCVLSPLVAAGLAAVGLAYFNGADAPSVYAIWFMADVMGLAIVTPPALMLVHAGRRKIFRKDKLLGGTAALAALLVVALGVFAQSHYPVLFVIFPALIIATFMTGFTGAAIGVFGVSVIAIACTNAGLGPVMLVPGLSPRERILLLQIFLLVVVMTIFPLAAVLEERRRMESRLKQNADTDILTGLASRSRFQEIFAKEWMNARRTQSPISIAMIDVDYFKPYNDSYGHLRGDECLAAVGQILGSAVRRPADFVARYGGEEFVLVLPDTVLSGALQVAESIHHAMAQARLEHEGGLHGHITVSIGVSSVVPGPHTNASALIAVADSALYKAKNAGRARTETAICEAVVDKTAPADDGASAKVVPLRSK